MSKLKAVSTTVGAAPGSNGKIQTKIKIAERVAAELRREIVTGKLRPGDKLHSERDLQDQFGISRPTLREALRMLESESLIVVARGQYGGARVTEQNPTVIARKVGACLQMQGTTLRDVWQARSIIEPGAARLLASAHHGEAIIAMRDNVAKAQAAIDDPVAYGTLTNEFSLILTRHCGNQTLHVLATLIQDIVAAQHVDVTVRTHTAAGVERMRQLNIRGREKLVDLIEKGDGAAAEEYWRDHLEKSGTVVFSTYQAEQAIDMVQLPEGNTPLRRAV